MSNAEELIKLKELLDSGLLSEEEFVIEKNKILNKEDNLSTKKSNKLD